MSVPSDQSPGSQFRLTDKNSPDVSRNFKSPFTSPRNGNPDFPDSSPMKNNFNWRNNRRSKPRFYQIDHQNQYYSPRGGRRGGGNFRGRGHHRGSTRDNADITLYVNPSMLADPWKDLTELLQPRMIKSTDVKAAQSADTTPNDSLNSINTSTSNNEETEQVTEDSLLTSDTSADVSYHTVEENVPPLNAQPAH